MAGGSDSSFGHIGRSNDPNDIDFLLYYDPRMKDMSMTLTYGDIGSIRNSPFNIAKATKVLIHGLTTNTFADFPSIVKDAYLENEYRNDINIIVVNWSKLSGQNQAMWFDVIKRVKTVGTRVADFLLWMNSSLQLNLQNTHLVGHWFGAHLAGIVGNIVNSQEKQIGRITGLDPRDPGYFADDHNRRLEKNDAAFVDVYHTNESEIETSNLLGDVDFFVNRPTATPMHYPDATSTGDTNSIAHRIFAQSIIDGPYGNNVTRQVRRLSAHPALGSPVQIIVGEYCMAGTVGWFDLTY